VNRRTVIARLLGMGLLLWSLPEGCGWISPSRTDEVESKSFPEAAYLLGPEDVVKVSVWKDEQLTQEVVVRPDGMISFPLVGDVPAAGRTVEEVRLELVKRLGKFIPNPHVSVLATKLHSYKIYVTGRVNKPGEFLVGHYTDVLQALSLAGGLTPYAAENDIKVMRREKGEQKVYRFRYGDVRNGKALEQNILLQRGDVVVVP
jgi:polysaccharide biosynthesis/export protein